MSFNQSYLHESITSFDKSESMQIFVEPSEKIELTKKQKLKKSLYSFLMKSRNRYFFCSTLGLINFIIEKNNVIIESQSIDIMDYLFYNFDGVLKLLGFLEKINFESLKFFKEKIISQDLTLRNFEQKFPQIFSNFQYNIIPHSISFYDFSPDKMRFMKQSGGTRAIPLKSSSEMNSYDRLHLLIDEQICLFNIKEDDAKTIEEIKNLKFYDFSLLVWQVLISKFEIIIYILMICYYFYNKGVTCWILFIYMFLYLIFEEKKSKIYAWKFCFVYFVIIACFKFFFHLNLIMVESNDPIADPSEYLPLVQVFFLEIYLLFI